MAIQDAPLVTEEVTFEEFLSRYDGQRAEWVRGKVIEISPVNRRHQE